MVIAGIVIVLATFIAIIKQFETRLVLLLSELINVFYVGQLSAEFLTAFVRTYKSGSCTNRFVRSCVLVMLWVYFKCTEHMVYFISARP